MKVAAADLLQVHEGERTEAGLRENIRVGVQYIEAWLRGRGAVPLYNLMEDAATAEISRAQIWQWLHHKAKLADGRIVTPDLFRATLDDEMEKVRAAVGEAGFHGRPLRGGDRAVRGDVAEPDVRGVPDAAGLSADRLRRGEPCRATSRTPSPGAQP